MPKSRQHKGWYKRADLPHLDKPGLVQSINFRLYDAIPRYRIDEWKEELKWCERLPASHPTEVELRRRICQYEDLGHGACWLRQPAIASLVQGALLHFHEDRYLLIAWCVMPNHVHALIELSPGFPLDGIVHSWKSFTAKEANRELRRTGEFWMADYFDRYMRSDNHLHNTIAYIEDNPPVAGLVASREDWPWSSASHTWTKPG